MKFPRNARMFTGHLDAAPIACVLFCLLIFLLVALVVPVPGIPLHLPQLRGGQMEGITGAEGAKVTVGIGAPPQGVLYFQQEIMTDGEFARRLKEAVRKSPEPLTLIIQADVKTPNGRTIQVEQLAAEAGITNAMLGIQPGIFGPGTNNRWQ